ncbi:hypothetical protein E4U30_006311 [Claviceps sp. LM220 group G6]|nr:hypothetical protein E4U30_006311 [Claviceps sp. LM220 group G6]
MASEHTGTNNRVVRDLGWATVRGSRYTPRNICMTIQPDGILIQRKIDLVEAMSRPADFLRWFLGLKIKYILETTMLKSSPFRHIMTSRS